MTVHDLQVLAAAEVVVARADQEHEVALRAKRSPQPLAVVVDHADHAYHGSGVDADAFTPILLGALRRDTFPGAGEGLVVEADVAADDRQLERAAGIGEARHRLFE